MKIGNLVALQKRALSVAAISVEAAPALSAENEARRRRLVAGYNSLKGCIVLKGISLSRTQREELGALVYGALKTACAVYGEQAVEKIDRALPLVAKWARQYGFRARLVAGQILIWSVRRQSTNAAKVASVAKGEEFRQRILRQLAEKAAALAAVKAEIAAKVEEVRKGLFQKKITVKEGKKGLEKVLFGLDRNGIPVLGAGDKFLF